MMHSNPDESAGAARFGSKNRKGTTQRIDETGANVIERNGKLVMRIPPPTYKPMSDEQREEVVNILADLLVDYWRKHPERLDALRNQGENQDL